MYTYEYIAMKHYQRIISISCLKVIVQEIVLTQLTWLVHKSFLASQIAFLLNNSL